MPSTQKLLVTDPTKVGYLADAAEKQAAAYDVVIIGGGTAGCALASRISEDATLRVLLLEAGESGETNVMTRIPAAYPYLYKSKHDYHLYTTQQADASDRKLYWPRAKLLGGCTTMNGMMYHYGATTDYDEWAKLTGDESWAWDKLGAYFRKFEKHTPNNSYPVDQSQRSTTGVVDVGHGAWTSPLTADFVKACGETGIPATNDVNRIDYAIGATRIMTYISPNGERVTAERAYLTYDVLSRKNLTVATNARVTKIVFDTTGAEPKATEVEYTSGDAGPTYRVGASKEIVLSAGAVHTPQILMLSGIGPAEHLKEHSIPLLVDAPGVGGNLQDHLTVMSTFRDASGMSINFIKSPAVFDKLRAFGSTLKWLISKDGTLTTNIAEGAAFARTTDPNLFPNATDAVPQDESSSAVAPDIEIVFSPVGYTEHGFGILPPGGHLGVQAVLLRPQSKGTIRLASNKVTDAPVIDPQYLTSPNDVAVLVRGLKLALRIAQAPSLAKHMDAHETNPVLDHALHKEDDARLALEVRKRAETLYHPVGTARMGHREEGAVVDSKLQVYGVKGLRIADASIFPRIPAGHTAAPVLATAEKCADLVKESLRA